MIREILTAEQLSDLIEAGVGYLYNDFGGRDPKLCPIHAIGCRWVPSMRRPKSGRLGVRKLWSNDLDALIAEIGARGKVFAFCGSEPGLGTRAAQPIPGPPTQRAASGPRLTSPLEKQSESDHFQVRAEGSEVTVSSAYRLQFDDKPRTKAFKAAIGVAVATMAASGDQMLEAVYTSDVTDAVDAENVLLYNVGTGRFAAAAIAGLRVERVYAKPRGELSCIHHHRYALVPVHSASTNWRRVRLLTQVTGLHLPRLDAMSKPDSVWLEVRRSVPSDSRPHLGYYALDIELTVGTLDTLRPADIVKPLVDGIVAGLHAYDGRDAEVVTQRLAGRLGLDLVYVSRLLHDDSRAWLGTRRLLWTRADGVQWNPGDDLCVSLTMRVNRDSEPQWRMDLQLYTVESLERELAWPIIRS